MRILIVGPVFEKYFRKVVGVFCAPIGGRGSRNWNSMDINCVVGPVNEC